MMIRRNYFRLLIVVVSVLLTQNLTTNQAYGQFFTVSSNSDLDTKVIEIAAGGSKRIKFNFQVPELLVEKPEVMKATPVSPDEILVSGLKPGHSALTVSDADNNLHTVNVHVTVDVRKLQHAIRSHFPSANVNVHALQTGVIIRGNVATSGDINNIMLVARDYFPTNVINQMQVGGGQTVSIKVRVYEVSRTKLRELGVDWSVLGGDVEFVSGFADLITGFADGSATNLNSRLGIFSDTTALNFVIRALETRSVAKLLDEPILTADNGRPAEFLSGGEIPIQVASGLGTNSIEFRPFGTKLDMVPIIEGPNQVRLEVRAEVSEVDTTLSNGTGVPGFRVRRVNTGVKMRVGHTLALAGDYREEVESTHSGLPHWMDKPILNIFNSAKTDQQSETELVFLITPQFVSDVPGENLGPLPGRTSQPSSDVEFYRNGHLEVPGCADDCPLPTGPGVAPQGYAPQGSATRSFGAPQGSATRSFGAPQGSATRGFGQPQGSATRGGFGQGSATRSIQSPAGVNLTDQIPGTSFGYPSQLPNVELPQQNNW